MSKADARPLDGARVVITRPLAQSTGLAMRVEQAGATTEIVPLLEIEGLPATPQACAAFAARPDIVIFISANAATHGVRMLQHCALALDPATEVAAVGAATARTLAMLGLDRVTLPAARFDSEGLLDTDLLREARGKRVLIVRGDGGREYLAKTLRARGAEVAYLGVYRRVPLAVDAHTLDGILAAAPGDVAWIVTSGEALQHLFAAAAPADRARLAACAFVLIGERLAGVATSLGITGPVHVAPQMSDDGLMSALLQWRGTART